MRIEMLTSMAGPGCTRQAGEVVDVPDDEAKRLLAKGFAKEPGPGKRSKPETAAKPKPKATKDVEAENGSDA